MSKPKRTRKRDFVKTENKKKLRKKERLNELVDAMEEAEAAYSKAQAAVYAYFSTAHVGAPTEKFTLEEIVQTSGVSKPTVCRHLKPSAKRDS